MNASRPHPRFRQRGIVSVVAAIILIAVVILVLSQTHDILGNTSNTNQTQGDSVAAFFLAESGIERGKLALSAGPTESVVCTGLSAVANVALGNGTFSLSGEPSKGGVANNCTNDCDTCKITSTGRVGNASRTVEVSMVVSSPSGGAAGCGGGGSLPAGCPVAGTPASEIYQNINQSIEVTTSPVVLYSAMAFARHPAGSANNADANTCIAEPGGSQCITQWDTESNSSAGTDVVGNRGSAIRLTPATLPTTYTLTQTLSRDSLFAAAAAKISQKVGGPALNIIGSYWDDSSNSPGSATRSGNTNPNGLTNNGAACAAPDGTAACPNDTPVPNPPTYSTKQASKSWCHEADTMILSFSGGSATNSDGSLSSFRFGTSPESTPVPTPGNVPEGTVPYPRPVAGVNSFLYASLRYLYNPTYLSPPGAAYSGALVSAAAGVPRALLDASVTSGSPTLTVTSIAAGYRIYSGDRIYCESGGAGCTAGTVVGTVNGNTACGGTFPCTLPGSYTLAANSPLTNSTRLEVRSPILQVSAVASGWLSGDDVLTVNGTTTTVKIASVPGSCTVSCNTAGDYGLDTFSAIATSTSNVETNGYTINVPSSTTAPVAGTIVEARYPATGKINLATTLTPACVAASPTPTRFFLNAWDAATKSCGNTRLPAQSRLVADQVCGGICAFFNHDTAVNAGMTSFSVTIPGTKQWAAGMTCITGVDPGTIEGLVGTTPSIVASKWHEVVR